MSELRKSQKLVLPPSLTTARTEIDVSTSVVVVGANGSGKTRFGVWFDLKSPQQRQTHRIAALRSLAIPEACSTSSLDIAENALLYGYPHLEATHAHKVSHKWGKKPNTHQQSDFDKLLVYLFTDEFDVSTKYRQQAADPSLRTAPPMTRLDVVKSIWESVLPHRELLIGGGKIEARSRSGSGKIYHGSEMSDGERVIFYLIGQSLAAKPNAILIIDEPELHLHRALQARLWDAIEGARPDCIFVYLTHDLDFAATRLNAIKIWLKAFEDDRWDWHILPSDSHVPDRLLMEILGSRKPILFVEGDRDSLDFFIFSRLYPEHTVVPCGGASAVIHATRSFAALKNLHNLECRGIIDRDFRTAEEVAALKELQIFSLEVSEVENLFLLESVLRVVAAALHRQDGDSLVDQCKALVFRLLEADKVKVASAKAAAAIEAALRRFNNKALGSAEISEALNGVVRAIDPTRIYADALLEIESIAESKDYSGALRIFNNKGLLPQAAHLFGFKGQELGEFCRRLLAIKSNGRFRAALLAALPELDSPRGPEVKSANAEGAVALA